MEQGSDSVTSVIRPTFKPTEDDLAAIEDARKAWAAVTAAEAGAWKKIQGLRDRDIPDLAICELIPEVTRSTLNRKLGPRKPKDD